MLAKLNNYARMMDELELNTLHRFVKHSPGLSLEQHGSCEVPAGCGGVVLRWLNPAHEAYLHFTFYTPGEGQLFLDGEEMLSSAFSVPVGRHLLAIHLKDSAAFALAVLRNPRPHQRPVLVSHGDESWRATRAKPPGQWRDADFAEDWQPLKALDGGGDHWKLREAQKLGARLLGVQGSGPLWVRKVFELHP